MPHFASAYSSLIFEDFMAMKRPPALTKGIQSSDKTLRRATALLVHMSKLSLRSLLKSSALVQIASTLVKLSLLAASLTKLIFLPVLSIAVILMSLLSIASGKVGNPAPQPTSITVELGGMSREMVAESMKCL